MSDTPRRDEQTFDPSPRQREKFRQQGRVLLSHDLTTGLVLLASCTVFGQFGEDAARPLAEFTRHAIRTSVTLKPNAVELRSLLTNSLWTVTQSLLMLVSAVMVLGTLTSLVQTGFNVTSEPLQLDVAKLSLSKGWQRLWSRKSAFRALLAVVKLVILAWVTWTVLQQQWPQLPRVDALLLRTTTGWQMATQAGVWMSLCLIALGAGDFLFQRSEYEQDLRMTREQLKEGQKQDEMDPHLRARVRKLQREQSQRRMLTDVPRAGHCDEPHTLCRCDSLRSSHDDLASSPGQGQRQTGTANHPDRTRARHSNRRTQGRGAGTVRHGRDRPGSPQLSLLCPGRDPELHLSAAFTDRLTTCRRHRARPWVVPSVCTPGAGELLHRNRIMPFMQAHDCKLFGSYQSLCEP